MNTYRTNSTYTYYSYLFTDSQSKNLVQMRIVVN
jgi:hypothetical protein